MDARTKTFIEEQRVGGVILFYRNLLNVSQSIDLIDALKQTNEHAKVPLFISIDEEGGRITRLPAELTATPSSRTSCVFSTKSFLKICPDSGGIVHNCVC